MQPNLNKIFLYMKEYRLSMRDKIFLLGFVALVVRFLFFYIVMVSDVKFKTRSGGMLNGYSWGKTELELTMFVVPIYFFTFILFVIIERYSKILLAKTSQRR